MLSFFGTMSMLTAKLRSLCGFPHATWLEVIFGSVSKATAETRKTVREKAEQHGFEAAIRIGVSDERAVPRLRALISALKVLESAGVRIHDEPEQSRACPPSLPPAPPGLLTAQDWC